MNRFKIGVWNANGLQATTINDILQHCHSLHMLFITETWFLHPSRIPTAWQQHHIYGTPVAGNYRGSMGICALISPNCPYPVRQVAIHNRYTIGFAIRNIQIRCLYLPPSIPDEEAIEVIRSIPLQQDMIICGDLNARLGQMTGDHDQNPRGTMLKDWILEQELIVHNGYLARGTPTYLSFRNDQEISNIIDLFITNFTLTSPAMEIKTELSLGSDHKLTTLDFHYEGDSAITSASPPRKLWHLSRLQEETSRERYIEKFTNLYEPLLRHIRELVAQPPAQRPEIDEIAEELNNLIYSSLKENIGERPHRPKEWKWFWTPQLQASAKLRDRLYKRWRRATGFDKIEWWNKHQQANSDFRTAVKAARRQAWRNHCEAMERDPTKAATKIKQLRRRRMLIHTYSHPDGPQVAAESMCQHLARVYDGNLIPSQRPTPNLTLQHPADLEDFPMDADTIQQTIRLLPNRKAPGIDQLKAEMLKPIGKPLAKILDALFRLCWQWSYTPSHWRHAQVCPIYKKGDPTIATNYRPISLTSVMRKLLEICLASTLHLFSPDIDPAQGGFRHRRSALDQVVSLQDLMSEILQTSQTLSNGGLPRYQTGLRYRRQKCDLGRTCEKQHTTHTAKIANQYVR